MSAFDLDAFVGRSRALVDARPPTTRRETRAWLVDPFLETLGWDVHADTCVTDSDVDGTRIEYVPTVDGIPALFVAIEPFGTSLEKDRAIALLETMAWTGVDRAIYTNGHDYLLLAGTTDVDRLACQLPDLADHEPTLAHYTRETIGQRLERHARPFVARQFAIQRADLVDAIVDELTSATKRGDAYSAELESAADRFLERLVASFADDEDRPVGELEAAGRDVSIEFSETTISEDDDGASQSITDSATEQSSAAESSRAEETRSPQSADGDPRAVDERDSTTGSDDDASVESTRPTADDGSETADNSRATPDDADADTEYVVRFFNDRGSIGAIGHSASDQALVSAAEYLFERGLSGVTVPWSPDDADDSRAVLHESPTHPDGTPMTAPQQLSNGLYLETAGDVDERAARVEALVTRAGLRAMLTGDWGE